MMNDDGSDEDSIRYSTLHDVEWYATQAGRGVEIRERGTDGLLQRLEPPTEWGDDWGWNIAEDGNGIVFTRRRG